MHTSRKTPPTLFSERFRTRVFHSVVYAVAALSMIGCSQNTEEVESTPATPLVEPTSGTPATPLVESTSGTPAPPTALARGIAFLAENGKRASVVTTASGLQYEVLASGTGATPGAEDFVTAHYHGTLVDGHVFDSSVQRGQPIELRVNGVIKGWQEALQMMRVGDKWKLYVPSELAYGKRGQGASIGPDETLIFEVELLDVRRP